VIRNLVNLFMNYYQRLMDDENEDDPIQDDFISSIFSKNKAVK